MMKAFFLHGGVPPFISTCSYDEGTQHSMCPWLPEGFPAEVALGFWQLCAALLPMEALLLLPMEGAAVALLQLAAAVALLLLLLLLAALATSLLLALLQLPQALLPRLAEARLLPGVAAEGAHAHGALLPRLLLLGAAAVGGASLR